MNNFYWWCSECQIEVNPRHVTSQEIHEDCGRPVDSISHDQPSYDDLKSDLEATKERLKVAVESLQEFGCCPETCARMGWSCGEPTPDGGYRVKVKGKWHHERPRCDCGFEDALKKIKGEI